MRSATGISLPFSLPPSLIIFIVFFWTGVDSPVRADSSAMRLKASTIRESAGMRSPACSMMISPGTTSFDGITISLPSRMTIAVGAAISFKASIDFSALYS